MAIDFPASPTVGQTYTSNSRTWSWTGTSWDAVGLPIVPNTNYILNADFAINQRQFTSTTSSNTYMEDRWQSRAQGSTGLVTHSRQAFSPGTEPVADVEGSYYHRIVTESQSSTDSYAAIVQKMEDVHTLAGQTVTVSFWARSGTGIPVISVGLLQHFGTGGSANATNFLAGQTINSTWTRYSFTTTMPSLLGKAVNNADSSMWLLIYASVGSAVIPGYIGIQNNTFDIWGVQVEAGSVATPFKTNTSNKQAELAACQRYYRRKSFPAYTPLAVGVGDGGTSSRLMIAFDSPMRTTPTSVEFSSLALSDWRTFTNNVTTLTMDYQSPEGCRLTGAASSTGTSGTTLFLITTGSLGYLGFSAEL